MIPLGSFNEEGLVLCELFLVWERDAVDSLKRIVGRITKEI